MCFFFFYYTQKFIRREFNFNALVTFLSDENPPASARKIREEKKIIEGIEKKNIPSTIIWRYQ